MAIVRELSIRSPPPAPLLPAHEARPPPGPPGASLGGEATEAPSPFARLVRGLSRESDAGEAAVRGVLRATALDARSLLALQAGIYRYGETIDLAARLVDKASAAVKTVVQGGQ